jgi:hypothetical protein
MEYARHPFKEKLKGCANVMMVPACLFWRMHGMYQASA